MVAIMTARPDADAEAPDITEISGMMRHVYADLHDISARLAAQSAQLEQLTALADELAPLAREYARFTRAFRRKPPGAGGNGAGP